ncbi:hypothetical protein [Rhodospirillum sp. A1_3_36]|uniref:hypothetical protein n=1 Tax=Rhodospirillum sp. A1_3_36 TaxID=3391666 RepID=UPI0039A53D1C
MSTAERGPNRNTETEEAFSERPPHFDIPGFEKLPTETQSLYLRIPAAALDNARPTIEREIAALKPADAIERDGQADIGTGKAEAATATVRETQAVAAIDAFHRAETGDPDAKKELEDHKKELLGEEPDDADIFRTILESESSDPFAQDTAMEVMLSDEQAAETQTVLDLFQDFRGDLPSADDALPPKLQIDLFLKLTKGKGLFRERMDFARAALGVATDDGKRNLFEGLSQTGVLEHRDLCDPAIDALRAGTDRHLTERAFGREDAA